MDLVDPEYVWVGRNRTHRYIIVRLAQMGISLGSTLSEARRRAISVAPGNAATIRKRYCTYLTETARCQVSSRFGNQCKRGGFFSEGLGRGDLLFCRQHYRRKMDALGLPYNVAPTASFAEMGVLFEDVDEETRLTIWSQLDQSGPDDYLYNEVEGDEVDYSMGDPAEEADDFDVEAAIAEAERVFGWEPPVCLDCDGDAPADCPKCGQPIHVPSATGCPLHHLVNFDPADLHGIEDDDTFEQFEPDCDCEPGETEFCGGLECRNAR